VPDVHQAGRRERAAEVQGAAPAVDGGHRQRVLRAGTATNLSLRKSDFSIYLRSDATNAKRRVQPKTATSARRRVRTVVVNLEKSWDFKSVISRRGKSPGKKNKIPKILEKSWKCCSIHT